MAKTGEKVEHDAPFSDADTEAQRWVAALTLTGLLMTILFAIELHIAAAGSRANSACFQKEINGEHALMDAFLPPAAGHDAIADAMHACLHVGQKSQVSATTHERR